MCFARAQGARSSKCSLLLIFFACFSLATKKLTQSEGERSNQTKKEEKKTRLLMIFISFDRLVWSMRAVCVRILFYVEWTRKLLRAAITLLRTLEHPCQTHSRIKYIWLINTDRYSEREGGERRRQFWLGMFKVPEMRHNNYNLQCEQNENNTFNFIWRRQ